MKKLFLLIIAFLCGFFIVLLITFPYKKTYDKIIQKITNKLNLQTTYNIDKASLTKLYLTDVTIKYKHNIINFNKIYAKVNPIKFPFNKKFLFLEVLNNKDKAIITAKKIDSNEWQIDGIIPISFFINFIVSPYKDIIIKFKNKEVSFNTILKKEKDKLKIVKLNTTGTFYIEASGEIKNKQIILSGKIKLGKLSQKFQLKKKI